MAGARLDLKLLDGMVTSFPRCDLSMNQAKPGLRADATSGVCAGRLLRPGLTLCDHADRNQQTLRRALPIYAGARFGVADADGLRFAEGRLSARPTRCRF